MAPGFSPVSGALDTAPKGGATGADPYDSTMPLAPVQTLRLAAGAARRALVRDLAFAAGRGMSLGGAAALFLIGAAKLGASLPAWPVVVGVSVGVGWAASSIWAVGRRWSVLRGAQELDARLGLKDRLSTAVSLSLRDAPSDPFAHWAIADAERTAPTVKIDRAIPVRLDWTWSAWPLLTAGTIAVALFVPVRPPSLKGTRPEPTQAQRTQTAAQLHQTAAALRQGLADERVNGATEQQLKALEQLESELAQGRVDPQQASVQAAKQIKDTAQRLESAAAADQHTRDTVREELTRAADSAKPSPKHTSPLMEALQRGDLKSAAEAAAAAAEGELTTEERQQLARDLDQLAQALAAAKEQPVAPKVDEPKPALPVGSDSPPSAPEGSIPPAQPNGQDPATKEPGRQPTQPSAESPPHKTGEERAPKPTPATSGTKEAEQRERVREALRDAAKELREPPEQRPDRLSPQNPSAKPGQPQPPEGNGGDQPEAQKGATGEPRQPSQQKSPDGKSNDGQNGAEPSPGNTPEKPAQGPQGATGEGQKQQTPAPGSQSPGGQPTRHEPGKQGEQPGQTPGAKPEGDSPEGQPGTSGATGSTPDPGAKRSSPSSDGAPKGNAPETGQKTPSGSGLERAARELKRLSEGSGKQDQERVRQLREMSKKMLEQSTPEQRERYRKLAEEFARQNGDSGPGTERAPLASRPAFAPRDGQNTPIDARQPPTVSGGDKPPERTISQWYSDKPIDRNQPPGGPAPVEALRQAAQGAERAIEQQQVPRRYQDLVRRVFRRYSEQAPR